MNRKGARTVLCLGVCALVAGAVACGMGDKFVTGIGNGGNRIFTDSVIEEVAEALASNPIVPRIDDEALVRGFAAIRTRAEEGDAEAVLILFRVAEYQRSGEADD